MNEGDGHRADADGAEARSRQHQEIPTGLTLAVMAGAMKIRRSSAMKYLLGSERLWPPAGRAR
ncbi:MAG: hypothetical protein WDN69_18500 [Aliidongia sp.]